MGSLCPPPSDPGSDHDPWWHLSIPKPFCTYMQFPFAISIFLTLLLLCEILWEIHQGFFPVSVILLLLSQIFFFPQKMNHSLYSVIYISGIGTGNVCCIFNTYLHVSQIVFILRLLCDLHLYRSATVLIDRYLYLFVV